MDVKNMLTFEYGLKTGDMPEKEMVKIFEKALSKVAGEINDSRIPKKRKLKKYTGPFGRSTPDAEPPEYDYIYLYSHRPSNLFLQLYPNQEKNGRVKFPEEGITFGKSKSNICTFLRNIPRTSVSNPQSSCNFFYIKYIQYS